MTCLAIVSLAVTMLGLILTLAGAGWLLFGIRESDRRFSSDGNLYPGEQTSVVVPALIRAQRWPGWLALIGGSVQLVGGVLAIAAALI
jgi:hypothetical protein